MRAAAPQQPSSLRHPLVILGASYALGVVLARFTALPVNPTIVSTAGCSIAAVYLFVRRGATFGSLVLTVAFFCGGATLMTMERLDLGTRPLQRLYDDGLIRSGEPVEVTGVIGRSPEPAPDGFYLSLAVEKLRFKDYEYPLSGQVSLFCPARDAAARTEYESLELLYGARVRLMTALSRMEQFRNPGVSSLTEYLERRNLDATGIVKSPLLVERLENERVFLPLALLYEWRQRLMSEIDAKFSMETGGVLKAALLGNRFQLSRAASERFREGGTFHVLVISGLHISFIGGLALFLVARVTKRRVLQFTVSAAFLWAYTIAVGAEVSVVRAALMFTVVALAPVVHRRARSLNALGGATLFLLIWRPLDLFDPSFQLTFLSVLAIIVIAWPLLERLRDVGAWHPTREAPYPPSCPRWLRVLGETLFWSERAWQADMARANFSYRLFKTALASRLERLRLQRILRYCFSAVVISVSVQIVLLPLLVLYFHRLSLSSILLNILVGVLMALLALTALAALLISHFSLSIAAPLYKLSEALTWLMVHSVDPFLNAGIASVRLPEYAGWPSFIYLLYYVPLAILAAALARWNPFTRPGKTAERKRAAVFLEPRFAAIALIGLLTLIVAHPLSAGIPDERLQIDFLDVGQGDSALVTMPDGTTLLVDGGGRPSFNYARRGTGDDEQTAAFERDTRSIGEAVVSEYLWWRGLDSVDYILATHADADHIDGLNDVARNFDVRGALVARAPATDREFAQFAATADEYNVPVRLVGRGDVLRFGAVRVEVLWPPRAVGSSAQSSNDDSIVLRVRFGNRTFLLTGDIEKDAEAAITAVHDDLQSDVVKAAHHGSRTSSTNAFVNDTKPAYTVISVGLTSIFGHPHQEVVERWLAGDAEILTTGKSGTITISTDGNDLRVETFIKK